MFENRYLYLLMLPALAFYAVFAYAPMYGLLMAFKDYNATLGVWGSEWVGLKHFKNLMGDPYFLYVLRNTLVMSFSQIIICFPVPIALAILFNEMRGTKLKRTLQTVYTFPHFLSWVVLSGIVISASPGCSGRQSRGRGLRTWRRNHHRHWCCSRSSRWQMRR